MLGTHNVYKFMPAAYLAVTLYILIVTDNQIKKQQTPMQRFCGKWKNRRGDQLEINLVSDKEAFCNFISGTTQKPIKLPYVGGRLSTKMKVELDYYESGIEIDLGRELKLCLDDPDFLPIPQILSGGISRPLGE